MEKIRRHIKTYWSQKNHFDKFIIASSALFLAIICFFALLHQDFFTPDQFFVIAFVVAIILGQGKSFLWNWTPFVLFILGYEYLRGLIPQINRHIHFALMPAFDKLVFFGHIPSVWLQGVLWNPNHIHWYDYAAVILYFIYFIVPLVTAFVFWMSDEDYFREYVIGVLALSYITFLTYLAFPAAPPWMASQFGTIPQVTHLTDIIVSHMLHSVSVPTVYRYFGANLTAAVPSLHAAFPVLTSIYIYKKVPKLLPVLILYTLGVWWAVMYLGEHYFFDVFLGALYALIVYLAIQRVKNCLKPRQVAVTKK